MAQLQAQFTDERTARAAVEKLRAMDIPDSDIVLSREGKGADAKFLLTAEVPDGQFSAAQAIVNSAAGGSSAPANAGGGQVVADTLRAAEGENTGTVNDVLYAGTGDEAAPSPDVASRAGLVVGTSTAGTATPDIGAQAGPGVIGHGALGGPAAFTARAAAIGSEQDTIGDDLAGRDPDADGDTMNSTSPR